MTNQVFLMVACYLSMLDNPNEIFEDTKIEWLNVEKMKDNHITFTVDSEPYLPIVKRGFIEIIEHIGCSRVKELL